MTPQTRESCRYVRGWSVRTRVETPGLCAAIVLAENPLFVKTTTRGACSIPTAAVVAAAIATSVATAVAVSLGILRGPRLTGGCVSIRVMIRLIASTARRGYAP